MSTSQAGDGTRFDDHPQLLPWYVAGTLNPEEARAVEAHLAVCAECRASARGFAMIARILPKEGRTDHVESLDLVLFEADDPAIDPVRRGGIVEHLRDCSACAEDLDALRQARRNASLSLNRWDADSAAPGALILQPGTAWAPTLRPARIAMGILVLTIVATGAYYWGRAQPAPRTVEVAMRPIASIALSSPERGAREIRTLVGPGPWSLSILLPFRSIPGDYRVRLEMETSPAHPIAEIVVTYDPPRPITILVNSLPADHDYRLVVVPLDTGVAALPLEYTLQVVGAGAQGPSRRIE